MGCPKRRQVYPDTGTRVERPYLAAVHKADPDYAKRKRFDPSYEFGKRRFVEDTLRHGAYISNMGEFTDDYSYDQTVDIGPVSFDTRLPQDAGPMPDTSVPRAIMERQFRLDNGFCDPPDPPRGDFNFDFADAEFPHDDLSPIGIIYEGE